MKTFALALCLAAACLAAPDVQELGASTSVATGTDCSEEATTDGCTWRTWTAHKCGAGSAGITIAAADRGTMDDSEANCKTKCDATTNCVAFVYYTGSGSLTNKCGLASKCYKGTDDNWKLYGREAKRGWVGPWAVPDSIGTETDCDEDDTGSCTWRKFTDSEC